MDLTPVSAATITGVTAGSLSAADQPAMEDLMDALRAGLDGNAPEVLFAIPAGTRLVPVLYRRIDPEMNKRILSEFTRLQRPRFMKFLAQHHRNDLKRMGICDYGIACMSKGLMPERPNGNPYAVSVDHVIERSGSGPCGMERRFDAKAGRGAYAANHFNNLMLLTDETHQLKNKINAAQGVAHMKPGEEKWILMLVPERAEADFVLHPDNGKCKVRNRQSALPGHASFIVEQANDLLSDLMPELKQAQTYLVHTDKTLRRAFDAAASSRTPSRYRDFVKFYRSRKITQLKDAVAQMNLPEARKLHKSFQTIDHEIAKRAAREEHQRRKQSLQAARKSALKK